MSLARFSRHSHRWLSIAFTLAVVLNFVWRAVAGGEPPAWVTYSPLPALFLQLFTGLHLFALPYMGRGRARTPMR